MRRRTTRLAARALLGGLLLVGLAASPAAADVAGPSDFRSVVTGLAPAGPAAERPQALAAIPHLHAAIRGGDTYLQLTVDRGYQVTVEGYEGEDYLRFDKDGTVERNQNSPATYLNVNRRGTGAIPSNASKDATPDWRTVASGGSYGWHDHRVHWMRDVSPPVPRGHQVGGDYDPWKVPIKVNGTVVDVQGTLTYEHAMTPIPWVLLLVVAGAALAWLGRKRAVITSAGALVVVSALAIPVGRADFSSNPGGGNSLLWILPVVAVLAAATALVPRWRGNSVIGTLASVACLSAWVFLRFRVLTKPVLPTTLPYWFDRATTASALGLCVAAAYLAVTSGQLRLPELPDD